MKILLLVRGVSGAGKTSFVKALSYMHYSSGAYEHYEADMYFYDTLGRYNFDKNKLDAAHKWCQNATEASLQDGASVIVSNTSTSESEVKVYQDIAKKTGAEFISIIVENRHNGVSVHNVPEHALNRQKQRFSIAL